jgi:hypothetical protein
VREEKEAAGHKVFYGKYKNENSVRKAINDLDNFP